MRTITVIFLFIIAAGWRGTVTRRGELFPSSREIIFFVSDHDSGGVFESYRDGYS